VARESQPYGGVTGYHRHGIYSATVVVDCSDDGGGGALAAAPPRDRGGIPRYGDGGESTTTSVGGTGAHSHGECTVSRRASESFWVPMEGSSGSEWLSRDSAPLQLKQAYLQRYGDRLPSQLW
jgi:hypothetical protein